MIVSADTNIFIYAANPECGQHSQARKFFQFIKESNEHRFVLCELVLIEIYMILRNPTIMPKPFSASQAVDFCIQLRNSSGWEYVDYDPSIKKDLWNLAAKQDFAYRKIIDARLALTLKSHGIELFATANTKDFCGFDFVEVWNPIKESSTYF